MKRAAALDAALLLLGVALTLAPICRADETPSLALEPSAAGDHSVAVERAEISGHLVVSAKSVLDFAYRPLVLYNARQEPDPVVGYQLWQHTLVSLAIFRRAVFDLDVPFIAWQADGGSPPSVPTAPRAEGLAAFGDMRLGARVKLFGSADDDLDPKPTDPRTELALAARMWLPSAMDGYAGDGAVRGGGSLVASGSGPTMTWAFDAGVRSRPAVELPGALPTRVATSLFVGVAGSFFADRARHVSLGSEIVADVALLGGARFLDPRATAAHLFLTGNYRIAGGPWEIGAALGPGLGSGAGAAAVRSVLMVGFSPETPPAPPDADDDGIPDKDDACIDLPGIYSNDPVLHGCPEPEPDHDADAVPDRYDACPRVAGVPTGDRRTHGCPKDSDGDGVPDAVDRCPSVRGPGPPEGDGCPPPEPEPAVTETQIVIDQQVLFDTGTAVLLPASEPALQEIAKVLREHPELEMVEVQGHTDGTGTAELNRSLGDQRAEAVALWLVVHGIAKERLSAKGYGPDRPIADNDTEEGRAKNRRVELHIMKRKPASGGAP